MQADGGGLGYGVSEQQRSSFFEQLYTQHGQRVFRYLYYRVGDLELARDMHADVFVAALEAAAHFAGGDEEARRWLMRIAHDRLADRFRSHERRQRIAEQGPLCEYMVSPGPEQQDDNRDLQQSLEQLAPEQRAVIWMRFYAGLTVPEVASQLGRSELSVRSLQLRGIRALRLLLRGSQGACRLPVSRHEPPAAE